MAGGHRLAQQCLVEIMIGADSIRMAEREINSFQIIGHGKSVGGVAVMVGVLVASDIPHQAHCGGQPTVPDSDSWPIPIDNPTR